MEVVAATSFEPNRDQTRNFRRKKAAAAVAVVVAAVAVVVAVAVALTRPRATILTDG